MTIADVLGVSRRSWERAAGAELQVGALIAVGAWAIMAWNRFGPQGLTAPRAGVRFVLIGFYAWIAVAVALWLVAHLMGFADRRQAVGPPDASSRPWSFAPSFGPLRRLVVLAGMAHRPLLILAVALQVLALFGAPSGIGWAVAVVCLGLWQPAMLLGAQAWSAGDGLARAALVALPVHALWLLTAGWYLAVQVGHLL